MPREFFDGQVDVPQDGPKEPGADYLSGMNGNSRSASIGMLKEHVTAARSIHEETEAL
jgi:hypothetical protein